MKRIVLLILSLSIMILKSALGHNDALRVMKKDFLKRVGFIHITKTGIAMVVHRIALITVNSPMANHIFKLSGGTSIEKSIYSKYLNSFGHKQTIANFSNVGDVAVCVLRDPVSRFISIYNYYRYGSDVYQREVYWKAPVNR